MSMLGGYLVNLECLRSTMLMLIILYFLDGLAAAKLADGSYRFFLKVLAAVIAIILF